MPKRIIENIENKLADSEGKIEKLEIENTSLKESVRNLETKNKMINHDFINTFIGGTLENKKEFFRAFEKGIDELSDEKKDKIQSIIASNNSQKQNINLSLSDPSNPIQTQLKDIYEKLRKIIEHVEIISDLQMVKNYGKVHKWIKCMAVTNNGRYLFTSGEDKHLKQWCIKAQRLIKDYGKVSPGWICCMAITSDDKYLFTGGRHKHLKQWDIDNQELVTDYQYEVVYDSQIECMVTTSDGAYLFTGHEDESNRDLMQWSIERHRLVKNYGSVHGGKVLCMCITPNGAYLFTGGADKRLKQWSVDKEQLIKDYGEIDSMEILSMIVTHDGKCLFTAVRDCYLKQWSIENQSQIKDYSVLAYVNPYSVITCMSITSNRNYQYTVSSDCHLKQWSVARKMLVRDQKIEKLDDDYSSGMRCMAVTPNNEFLFVVNNDQCLKQQRFFEQG